MFNRRSFLISATTLTLAQLVSGCGRQQDNFKVLLLQGSIPPQLTSDFRKAISPGNKFKFEPEVQLKKIYNSLKKWQNQTKESQTSTDGFFGKKKPLIANLATLGDYWLTEAINQQLIQPFDADQFSDWSQLSPRWQQLVRRDREGKLAENGQIWGAPYRWGSTIIVYRRDKFKQLGWQPTDWKDLWHEDLRDRISLVDQSREVIGLTLKKLGYSYNTLNLEQISNLESELLQLNQQVKFYSSENYLQPLILGDTWLAVGWSTDILPLIKRYGDLTVIVPKSGTSLWADLWVQPQLPKNYQAASKDNNPSAIYQWIDFCWQPKAANQISLFTNAISPISVTMNPSEYPQDLQANDFFQTSLKLFERSEFLQPLPSKTLEQYQQLWSKIRQI